MSHSLGVDVGGTFTDFVAIDEHHRVSVFKCLTTPSDPALGVLDGTRRFAEARGVDPSQATGIIHGTTLVANSLIERRGARTALITTAGFRDVLELGREARYDLYDLNLERPEPLVPRPLRFEIRERIRADGSVLEPLDIADARKLAGRLKQLGVESVAIVLLHSYANPLHEQMLAEITRAEAPGIDVTLSRDVAPEWREYERASTAAANAFVRPLVRRYLAHLEQGFADLGAGGRLYVLLSHGGVTSSSLAAELAIELVESGPAGGAMAAAFFGNRIGLSDVISFDMGGTTTKVSLIEQGVPLHVPECEVARVARFKRGSGLPLKVPTIELIEIGAGGGSLGHSDILGLLKVGPNSAGAVPGPACYGRGGTQATVTDADLHLGFLDHKYFLGGAMALDPSLADAALARLGAQVGIDSDACARGMYEIVNRQMSLAVQTHVVERGHDPRRFTLVAFGGAGPVHAYEVARHLGIRRLLYPPAAGVASALGFLVAPFAVHLVRTCSGRLGSINWMVVAERFKEMERQAHELLERGGASSGFVTFERGVDMRYAGQGYEVPVPLPDGPLREELEPPLRSAFDKAYERRFGSHLDSVEAEALHWRLTGRVQAADIALSFAAPVKANAVKGVRKAYFPEVSGFLDCTVYDRYRLVPRTRLQGPMLIEERESTIVVGPSADAQVDDLGSLIVTFK